MATSDDGPGTGSFFPKTRWTLVQSFKEPGNPQSDQALEELCRIYWQPVYGYIRRRGNAPADAEDLTQGFFAELFHRDSLRSVAAEKGKLRTFLLTAVTRHMASVHERDCARKRGGGQKPLPLDCGLAEEGFIPDPGHAVTPDLEFERQWTVRLLDQALGQTRKRETAEGRGALFEELKGMISLDRATDRYAAIAQRLGMSEDAVKVAAHRLRGRFRECLRQCVAETVSSEAEIDEEIRHLMRCFAPPPRD